MEKGRSEGWRKVKEGKLCYTCGLCWCLCIANWAETKAKGDVWLEGRGCPLLLTTFRTLQRPTFFTPKSTAD